MVAEYRGSASGSVERTVSHLSQIGATSDCSAPHHSSQDINPKGFVPAIGYRKGCALYESLIICEFLEDAYPSHTPHLFPMQPFERAHARLWFNNVSKTVVPAFHRDCLLQGQTPEAQAAAPQFELKNWHAVLGSNVCIVRGLGALCLLSFDLSLWVLTR